MLCSNLFSNAFRMHCCGQYLVSEIEVSVSCMTHYCTLQDTFGILLQKHIYPDIAMAALQLNPINKAGGRAQSSQVLMSTSG